ncbi:MAG: cyclic nucleotide-binding domain-containing protein [Spirosomaceae bacterium]|jgi:CRP-like cAMP-binding protein|nr:cyclic nucleotide-binding domain-containing protein [Spirosomataceae bacterium]
MNHLDYFRLFHPVQEADWRMFAAQLRPKFCTKGEVLIVPGQVQRELYLVKSGVQMSFFDTTHKTHVMAFTYPPNLCAIPESFFFQTPSKYALTCLTDSALACIHFNDLQNLFDKSQNIERLFRRMTEAILSGVIQRHTELHSLTIEERYRAFCQRSPHLLQIVPHKYIASYLHIDPTNFSKLYNQVKI